MTALSPDAAKKFASIPWRRRLSYVLAVLFALALLFIGLVIAAGGAWLMILGGSWYYLLAGVGLVLSGLLLLRQRTAAVWVYLGIWFCTLVWAYWEVGLDQWALLPRTFAPTLLIPILLLSAARLKRVALGKFARIYGPVAVAALTLSAIAIVVQWFRMQDAELRETIARAAVVETTPSVEAERIRDTSTPARVASMTPGKTLQAGPDWPAYGGSSLADRYSTLSQINRANVAKLERAWTFRTGDMPNAKANGRYAFESTPLKVGDRLFVCTPRNILISVDAASGKQVWRFDPEVPDSAVPVGAICRGVAYYANAVAAADELCAQRIIEGTIDARLIAVDAKTGRPCSDFGLNGSVDLTVGLGETVPGWYGVTSSPTVVRGIVVVGARIANNQTRDAPSGVIRGYDAVTGKLAWAWDLGHPERSGAPPSGETYTRGTPNMWTTAAADEELGYVYAPLANASVAYFGANRDKLENEYSSSLVAIDVTTGKPAWHFQTVHHDLWDYDLAAQPSLVDLETQDGKVAAIIQPTKQGQIYVLNRKTGKPIFPVEESQAPGGGVEVQKLAKTQPYSVFGRVDQPALTERHMWGMSPVDQLWCRIQFKRASYDGQYTTPKLDRAYIQHPGVNGGFEWGGVAVDSQRGILVANYNDMPDLNWLLTRAKVDKMALKPINQRSDEGLEGTDAAQELSLFGMLRNLLSMQTWRSYYYADPQEGTPYGVHVDAGWMMPTGLPCKQPPYGGLRAIDLKTGKILWDHPLGTARNNGPFGIPTKLPATLGTPNLGGPLITAGGLIFIAASTDDTFRALDIETGKVLWQEQLPAGGQANPMTYEADGRQFVVIAAGGHFLMQTRLGDFVVAYAVPEAK